MSQPIEVKVPDIGDFEDVDVIEVLVETGQRVEREQSLITLESDKATLEVPSPKAGTIRELRVKGGDQVSQGSPIATLEPDRQQPAASDAGPTGAAGGGEAAQAQRAPATGAEKLPGILVVHENRGLNPHIEDVTRRFALENFIAFAPDALFPLGGYPGDVSVETVVLPDYPGPALVCLCRVGRLLRCLYRRVAE